MAQLHFCLASFDMFGDAIYLATMCVKEDGPDACWLRCPR